MTPALSSMGVGSQSLERAASSATRGRARDHRAGTVLPRASRCPQRPQFFIPALNCVLLGAPAWAEG